MENLRTNLDSMDNSEKRYLHLCNTKHSREKWCIFLYEELLSIMVLTAKTECAQLNCLLSNVFCSEVRCAFHRTLQLRSLSPPMSTGGHYCRGSQIVEDSHGKLVEVKHLHSECVWCKCNDSFFCFYLAKMSPAVTALSNVVQMRQEMWSTRWELPYAVRVMIVNTKMIYWPV